MPRSGVPGVLPRTTLSILECRCSPIIRPRNTHWVFFYPLTTNASYYNNAENIDIFFGNKNAVKKNHIWEIRPHRFLDQIVRMEGA